VKHAFAAGVAAVSIGIAVVVMGVSPAAAAPVVRVRGITTGIVTVAATAPAGDTGAAEATCAAGGLLVGGGYVVNSASTGWRVYVDAPGPSGPTWLVELVNFSATQPLSFSAYAICATSVPGKKGVSAYTTHVVYVTVNAPPYETAEAEAACPAGELRTGGGYDVYNVSPDESIYSNAPLGSDTWNVEIDNEVPVTTIFHSYAICLAKKNSKPVRRLTILTVHTAATAPPYSIQAADTSCGPKELMTGGGHVIASIGPYWRIQASAPVSADDWQVRVADLDNFSRDFDSFALCLAKA
jgi:hypothetical protein